MGDFFSFKRMLLFFAVLWLIVFPIQGTFYQIGLYVIPILVLAFQESRTALMKFKKELFLFVLCLAIPFFVSEVRALLLYDYSLTKDPFDIFWRLCLFPFSLTVACVWCDLKPKKIELLMVSVVVLYCVAAILSLHFDLNLRGSKFGLRDSGFITNPNPFGFLVAIAIIIALYNILFISELKEKMFYLISLPILLYACLQSGARSAWLGLIASVGVLVMIFFYNNRSRLLTKKSLILLCSFVVGVGILSLWGLSDSEMMRNVLSRFERAKSGDIRLEIWQHYLEIAKQHLVFGIPVQKSMKEIAGVGYFGTHNMYLTALVEGGIVALIGLFLVLGVLFRRSFSTICTLRPLPIALLLLLCVYCFFNSQIYGHVMTQSVFALIVLLIFFSVGKEAQEVTN